MRAAVLVVLVVREEGGATLIRPLRRTTSPSEAASKAVDERSGRLAERDLAGVHACSPLCSEAVDFSGVAIAGRRIRDMLPLWHDTMGGRFVVGADNPEIGWRAVRLELAGVWCLELIEPLAGSAFLDRFLRGRPEGGLHHVTFLVDDVRASFEWFTARGYEPFGADREWFQMFVHPRRAGGVLLQLMRRYEARGDGAARGGGARGDGAERPAAERPAMTLEDVLAGRGHRGTGVSSP